MLCNVISHKEVVIANVGQKIENEKVVDADTLAYLKRTIDRVLGDINQAKQRQK